MCSKPLKKSEIKKILVILLSNIGDVVVNLLVLDILIKEFPQVQLSVVSGPKGEPLFRKNPLIHAVYIFDKHWPWLKTFSLVRELHRERFDLVVDLRNTAIPIFLMPKFRTSIFQRKRKDEHIRLEHIERLRSIVPFSGNHYNRVALPIPREDQNYVTDLIKSRIGEGQKFCVVCPSAADHRKRWPAKNFAKLCDRLASVYGLKIVLTGEGEGEKVVDSVTQQMKQPAVALKGETTLLQLAELFKRSALVIANDSGPMHLASYLNVPILALFGPTDPGGAAPWSITSHYLRKNGNCLACQDPKSRAKHNCMEAISADDVFVSIRITPKGVVEFN